MICKKIKMQAQFLVHLAEPKNRIILGIYLNRHMLNFN